MELEPITRKEQFLNAAATGDTSDLPEPITREEIYLKAIAENGGGGGGGGSDRIWYPSVSAQGVISWTKSSSSTTPTAVNIAQIVINSLTTAENQEV